MEEFCRLDCDRYAYIRRFLHREGLDGRVMKTGKLNHFLIRPGNGRSYSSGEPVKTLTAHYDRYPGSPGANDNGASVIQLLDLARFLKGVDYTHNCQILLTDGEEIRGEADSTEQGSYRLARLFSQGGFTDTVIIILDMCGLGDTMVYSTGSQKIRGRLSRREEALFKPLLDFIPTYSRGKSLNRIERFSDDLGFLHHGFNTLQISLLPWKERDYLSRDEIPPSWRTMHTGEDSPDKLENYSFRIMEGFLKSLSKMIISQ